MKANQNQKVNMQDHKLSNREKKHQASLKNNSSIHFQIGLIVVLFMVFGIFQIQFEKKIYKTPTALAEVHDGMITPRNYVIEKPKAKTVNTPKIKSQKTSTIIKVVKDDHVIVKNLPIIDKPIVLEKALPVSSIYVEPIPEDIDPIPASFVTQIPMLPGCEKYDNKKEQMACMSKKIAQHINNKFDSDLASDNDISGTQKIFVMFTINTNGNIIDVKARSPHPALQKEAIKAIQSLPKMKPGKKGNKKVAVSFSQPIIFEVE